MSSPPVIIFGFGPAGPLLAKSMTGANARYVALPGTFTNLVQPQPAVWRAVADAVRGENETLVVWANDALILWERLALAMAANREPDFLWPLPLSLRNGAVAPDETDLFLAVGGFEMNLFPFRALCGFHHAVRARALAKLLAVSSPDTMTLGEYLQTAWLNFESVKAPDSWLVKGDADAMSFDTKTDIALDKATSAFKHHHRQWQMGRVALEAQSRNTLAAADFCRANLDAMQSRMEGMMTRLPYHGAWPLKGNLTLPSFGHHPVVASLIWRGGYFDKARDLWTALFCQGAYARALDARHDGHCFGLLFAAQKKDAVAVCHAPSLQAASWAQVAIDANKLGSATVTLDLPQADDTAVAALDANAIPDTLWGAMDLFIPLDGTMPPRDIPQGYKAFVCEAGRLKINEVTDLKNVTGAALMILHEDRVNAVLKGAAS